MSASRAHNAPLPFCRRAPLIFGGRLPLETDDSFTLSLITNAEALAPHNASTRNAPIAARGGSDAHAWAALPAAPTGGVYVALFNAGNARGTVTVSTVDAGLPAGTSVCARDLWARAPLPGKFTASFGVDLPLHGAGLYHLTPC